MVTRCVLVLLVLSTAAEVVSAQLELPGEPASWIWSREVFSESPSAAVFVRDFELPTSVGSASLLLRAGDAWVAWVNGARVAAGSTTSGCELSEIPIGPLLREGANRVAIEVRFEGRYGGVLGCLASDGRCLVATDSRWRIERAADPALLLGWRLGGGKAVAVLGPAELASRCIATRARPAFACLGPPLDLAPQPAGDHSGTVFALPVTGLLELVLPPGSTGSLVRIDEQSGGRWEVIALPGAVALLDASPRPAGRIEVHGIGSSAAVLWPWTAACGDIADARRPVESSGPFGIALPETVPGE